MFCDYSIFIFKRHAKIEIVDLGKIAEVCRVGGITVGVTLSRALTDCAIVWKKCHFLLTNFQKKMASTIADEGHLFFRYFPCHSEGAKRLKNLISAVCES
jgi:hypothetical protein